MGIKLRVISLIFFVLSGAVNAAPVVIDFTALPFGTAVTNQFPGVTFSLSGGSDGGPPVTGNQLGGQGLSNSTSSNYPTAFSLIAQFTSPVSGVMFDYNAFGDDGNQTYTLFDSMNNIITTGSAGGDNSYDLSAFSNVSAIEWNNGDSTSWITSLDTLSFQTAVPEINAAAATMPLALLFGLVLLLERKRAVEIA